MSNVCSRVLLSCVELNSNILTIREQHMQDLRTHLLGLQQTAQGLFSKY